MSGSVLQNVAVSYSNGKWKKAAAKLAKEVLAPNAFNIDQEGRFPEENIRMLGKERLLGIGIPEEKGGVGGDATTSTLIVEELAKGCPSTAMCYLMHISIVPLLWRLAKPEQHEKFIKPIINGESLGSYSMSEKGSGSRLWHMDSYAVKKDDYYEVESFKSFSTSSNHCQFYFLAVKSRPDAGSNELNIFFVDGKDPNINIIGEWNAMGLRGTSSTPVHFSNCRIEKERLFGEEGKGYNLIMAYIFPPYVLGLSAVYLGIAQRAYHASLEFIKSRKYTDNTSSSLRDVETIQRYVAEMKTAIDTTKAYLDRISNLTSQITKVFDQLLQAEMLDELLENAEKDDFLLELTQLKIAACETAIKVSNIAMQVCGGSGYKKGSIVEQCYRDARAGSVMGPTDDILKVVIGKRILGLPFPWK